MAPARIEEYHLAAQRATPRHFPSLRNDPFSRSAIVEPPAHRHLTPAPGSARHFTACRSRRSHAQALHRAAFGRAARRFRNATVDGTRRGRRGGAPAAAWDRPHVAARRARGPGGALRREIAAVLTRSKTVPGAISGDRVAAKTASTVSAARSRQALAFCRLPNYGVSTTRKGDFPVASAAPPP
jgi:hypothetical protein